MTDLPEENASEAARRTGVARAVRVPMQSSSGRPTKLGAARLVDYEVTVVVQVLRVIMHQDVVADLCKSDVPSSHWLRLVLNKD